MNTTSESETDSTEPASGSRDYNDIPGTYVFDAKRSRMGYALNMMCMSLAEESNRELMRADEPGYLDQWDLTPEQRESVDKRQWTRMLELGGNVYYTFKLAAFDGMTFRNLAAGMTGVTDEEFGKMMMNGGRPVEGNRSNSVAATTSEAATASNAASEIKAGEQ